MTLQQMVEQVEAMFPQVGRTRIVFDINNIMDDFCLKSEVLWTEATLARTTALLTSDDTIPQYTVQLPTSCQKLLYLDTHYKDEVRINGSTLYLTYLDDDTDNIRVEYLIKPQHYSAMTDTSNVPEGFHRYLLAGL